MQRTPQKHLDSSLLGRVIGWNNDSGLLYTTKCGNSQFQPKSNVIPKPVVHINYSNKENTSTTLDEMNSEKGKPPNFYEGNKEKIIVKPEDQPAPFTILGGKPQ